MGNYETLGVPPEATSAEIKAAYRRASSAAHPDREGGSNEAQQAVNKAYEVLSQPERRAQYDETGSDAESATPHDEAKALLLRFFSDALRQDGPVLSFVRLCVTSMEKEASAALKHIAANEKRLQNHRRATKHRAADNAFHQLVDAELAQLARQRSNTDALLALLPLVRALADEYEAAEDSPATRMYDDAFDDEFAAGLRGRSSAWKLGRDGSWRNI